MDEIHSVGNFLERLDPGWDVSIKIFVIGSTGMVRNVDETAA
jgi:hypothetical protein